MGDGMFQNRKIFDICIEDILLGENYRKSLSVRELEELKKSIEEHGLLQPIIVNTSSNRKYTLITGQRRYLAHKLLNVKKIRCILLSEELSEEKIILFQLGENTKRKISSWDKAKSYVNLYYLLSQDSDEKSENKHKEKLSIAQFAKKIGKSPYTIRKAFKVVENLNKYLRSLLEEKKISYHKASLLAEIPNKDVQYSLYLEMKRGNWCIDALKYNICKFHQQTEEKLELTKQMNNNVFNNNSSQYISDRKNIRGIESLIDSNPELIPHLKNFELGDKTYDILLEDILYFCEKIKEKLTPHLGKLEEKVLKEERAPSMKKSFLRDQILFNYPDKGYKRLLKYKITSTKLRKIPIKELAVDPDQPRKDYDEKYLELLGESIKSIGQLEPIVVTPKGSVIKNKYMIILGHCRTKAAERKGIKFMNAVIADIPLVDRRVLQYEEDMYQEDIPSERAQAIFKLYMLRREENKDMQEKEFKRVFYDGMERWGFKKNSVKTALDYYLLDKDTRELSERGVLQYGAAAALSSIENVRDRYELALLGIVEGWSVNKFKTKIREYSFRLDEKKEGNLYQQQLFHLEEKKDISYSFSHFVLEHLWRISENLKQLDRKVDKNIDMLNNHYIQTYINDIYSVVNKLLGNKVNTK